MKQVTKDISSLHKRNTEKWSSKTEKVQDAIADKVATVIGEDRGLSSEEKSKEIQYDLENAGYLSDISGQKLSLLDIAEYDKKTIFEKLSEIKGFRVDVVDHLHYETPKAKNLKIVMIKIDREKHWEITETNFLEKMNTFGVRPMKYEEYLQFVLNNSKYLQDEKGWYIYMLERVVSKERYTGFIQAHQNGLGISWWSIYYHNFPFVIEE